MRIICAGASVLLLFSLVRAAEAEFLAFGPAPTRNFQPIQLIFLNLPFERAAALPAGDISLQVHSAESNVIATTQGPIESRLKFETNRTVVAARYGLTDLWEIGIDLPFISRFGGFLDPIIDEVEGVFGVGNIERDFYRNNTFGDFFVRRSEITLFEGNEETLEPGDFWISAKREVALGGRLPLLALRAAVKWPTGNPDKVTGSGEPDFALGIAAEYPIIDRLMVYGNLSVVFPPGPITPAELTLNPFLTQSFAAEYGFTNRWSAFLHQAVYQSPMHGTNTRLLDSDPVEIGLGVNFAWSKRLVFQLMAVDNISPVEPAADFSILLASKYRWPHETRADDEQP
jgi:hypothetical protein